MQLIMTGEMISAADAMQYGMVNKVVTQKELLDETKKILNVIHTKAPIAISKVIECINNFDHTQQGYDFEIKKFSECVASEDVKEGVTAFLEKRNPQFKGN